MQNNNSKPANNTQRGFSIIEIAVVVAIVSLSLVSLLSVSVYNLRAQTGVRQTKQATDYAKDAIEAVKGFRDATAWDLNGVGSLTAGANYHPELQTGNASSSWQMVLGAEQLDNFSRTLVFERVSRDPTSKNIESTYNAANDDPETRKMTATVSWLDKNVQITTYISNWIR